MPERLPPNDVTRIAAIELSALRLADVLPPEPFEGAALPSEGTPVYDLNGELLFHRVPIVTGDDPAAYADVAVHPAVGGPLIAASHGVAWDEQAIVVAATDEAHSHGVAFDTVRFVAYSFPKIALQFLRGGEEVLMLEWGTWAVVPPAQDGDRKPLEPGNFERWSLLDELPPELKERRAGQFRERLAIHGAVELRGVETALVSRDLFGPAAATSLVDTRELHFSGNQADHHVCYEVRGQRTSVWCVAASTQMLLDFYRYDYTQVRLAQELGLGTLAAPSGLPYSRVGDVVTVIEKMTSNALDATMIVSPGFGAFQSEIKANRPTISFIPGHSRTVAGYTRSVLNPFPMILRGLLVYDPWPPNAGVVTRWENFDTQVYQYAYSAVVKLV